MTDSRYSNSGLARAEALFVESHPRAAQYLDQAPVLVMWALPWSVWRQDANDSFARTWIAGHCESGIELKVFLRLAGFSSPMRRLLPSAILPSRAGVYQMLGRMDPAVLARIMPKTAKYQRAWLASLHEWLDRIRRWHNGTFRDVDALFAWSAEHFQGVKPEEATDLADFQFSPTGSFSTAWGLARAREEQDLWHRRITLESQLRGLPISADQAIDLGKHTDRFEVDPYELVALRTPREIAEEGTAMRHCVATYIKAVFNGESHIMSIRKGGKRVATLELAGPKAKARQWSIAQLKGPKNSPVEHTIQAMAMLFSEVMRDRQKASASLQQRDAA